MRQSPRALLIAVIAGGCNAHQASPSPDAAQVLNIVAHDVSPPLRELAKLQSTRVLGEIEMEPVRPIPHPNFKRMEGVDRVVQTEMGATPIAAPSVSFEGMGKGMAGFVAGGVPPDTDGDVCPNHYMQVVNLSLTIFSKTGTTVMGPMSTSKVWAGFPHECANTNDGDATIRYDSIADRWVIAQFSLGPQFNGPFFQCIAVSTTPDPTGTYNRYQFSLPALNDYPKIGLWPDAYYFTFNMFQGGVTFLGGKVCAVDRVKMLAGDPAATMQCFDAGNQFGGLLASDVDGKTLPPAGAPNYVAALGNNGNDLAYWTLHVDFTTPANSKFTGPTTITVTPYNMLCDGGTCVTQPTGGSQLDSLADRAMNRFVYRRFADHESLLLSHSVTAGAGGGVRWYELRTPNTPTVFQQGTFAPTTTAFRWLPSIAMDGSGDIAAIYSVSSSATNPGIRYAGRTPTAPAGTFDLTEGTIVAGAGVEQQVSRWGDYASLNIDPTDDCTFWATHEYMTTSGRTSWSTRVAAFTLPTCSAFSVAKLDDETVQQGGTANYTVTTTTTAGAAQQLQLAATGLPTGVTATFNPSSIMSGQTAMVTLTADTTAALGMTHYTVSATGTASSQMLDVALTVTPVDTGGDAGVHGDGGDTGGGNSGGCCQSSNDSPIAPALLGLGVIVVIGRRRRR